MQEKDMILVPLEEYRELVEDAMRGKALAEAFMANMTPTKYGVDMSSTVMVAVFRAVFPEDYQIWEDEQKNLAKAEEEEE